jgi:hypothetical protein
MWTHPAVWCVACRRIAAALLAWAALLPGAAVAAEPDWSLGIYGGIYYDSEPAGFTQGRANYLGQRLLALTGSKTFWRAESWPVSLEIDGMIGQQFGLESLTEIAVAPVLRWSGLPGRQWLHVDLRLAPLGLSHTSTVSSLERGVDGRGSRTLNYLFIELAFARPQAAAHELFVRLHHRCSLYDQINNYGANGEDFLALGYRYRF